MEEKKEERNPSLEKYTWNNGINFLEGILLMFVIIVHILNGDTTYDLEYYLLHTITMPLFLGITGYLLNREWLVNHSFGEVFKRYFKRMLFPYLIAVSVYYIIEIITGREVFDVMTVLDTYIFPRYHLWYIPTIFLYIIVYRFLKKTGIPEKYQWFFFLILSACIGIFIDHYYSWPNTLLSEFIHTYKPYYMIFFFTGVFARQSNFNHQQQKKFLWGGIFFYLLRIGLFFQYWPFHSPDLYPGNIFLIFSVVPILGAKKDLNTIESKIKRRFIRTLAWMGENSLYIYLYHALPLFLIR